MEEYRIKDADLNQFLHLVMGADGKPPIDFDMLQREGHYIVHSGNGIDFCLNEREAYLKGSMENLIAKSLCYFSDMEISFAIHVKDKTGKADIAILDNRRLAGEIAKRQVKGKSLTIHYEGGRTKTYRLSTDQYIRGLFGEKVDLIRYASLAQSLMRMRRDMLSGRGEIKSFVYEAENKRSLSAAAREAAATRERTLKIKTLEQLRSEWEEQQLLWALNKSNYCPALSDKEKLETFQNLVRGGGYHRISMETAQMAADFNIPCFVPVKDGSMDYVRDVKALDKSLPIYMKPGWDEMLDILVSKRPVPYTRTTLSRMRNAARDAYDRAKDTEKPQLAGLAIKITYFLEAVDENSLSSILQGEGTPAAGEIKAPGFLSEPEKEKFRYLYEKEQRNMMVAEKTERYSEKSR